MYFATLTVLCYFVQTGICIETSLANENRQGYDEELLLKTINKHFPESDTSDRKVLAEIIASRKGQLVLRNAAVKEIKKKIETQQERNFLDEPLDDKVYCKYDWLSWLPWLSCPQNTRVVIPLRYYGKLCNPH